MNNTNYNNIKDIIDAWDPVGLLAMHAPLDEYDSETNQIYELLKTQPEANADFVANCIYDIFIKSFGSDVFRKDICDCLQVANKILSDITQ